MARGQPPRFVCAGGGGNASIAYLGVLQGLEANFERCYGTPWATHLCEHMCGFAGASGGALLALCMCLQLCSADMEAIVRPVLDHPESIFSMPDLKNLIQNYGMAHGSALKDLVRQNQRNTCMSKILQTNCRDEGRHC